MHVTFDTDEVGAWGKGIQIKNFMLIRMIFHMIRLN